MNSHADTSDYLAQPDKWQAWSHPQFIEKKPCELFDKTFVPRYDQLHRDLWSRITRLHGTLVTLNELRDFPFSCIYGPGEMEFWRLVTQSFLDTSILLLHSLVADTGTDVHSLVTFRTEIMNAPWLRKEDRELLQTTLRDRKFDNDVKCILKRVGGIRHNRIAHSLIDPRSGSPKEILGTVSLDELMKMFHAAQNIFGALSFGSGYGTLAGDLMPSTRRGQPTRTCLSEVLDAIARGSDFVNMPEKKSSTWPMTRKCMDPESLRILNVLRERIGLPEV